MKTHSKIAIVALSLNLLLPTASLARNGADDSASPSTSPEVHSSSETETHSNTPRPSTEVKAPDAAKFCTNITNIRQNLTESTKGKGDKLKADFDKRSGELSTKRAELTTKISDNRLKSDAERTRRFTELEAKAKTPEQTAAIKAYEASVLAAIKDHRAAIDAADKTFLDGVTAAVGNRQADLLALDKGYQVSVAFAVLQAKASCTAGISPQTVRQNLATTLKALQSKFTEARKALEKNKPNLDTLKTAHKAAINQANANFRASLKTALTTLKAALGTPESSESPTPTPST